MTSSIPPLHRRRGPGCRLIRARLCGGGDRQHWFPPSDGTDHRMKGKQWLARKAAETFRPKSEKFSELGA